MAGVLGLDNTTSGDQGRIDGWINDAVVDMLKKTHTYVTSSTLSTTAGTSDYTLPSVISIDELYVTSSGTDYPLERVDASELLAMRRNSVQSSPPQYYALLGGNLLMLYPTPSGTDTITYYNTPVPTALSASADTPSATANGGIPNEYHYGLELYAMWKGADYDDDQSSAQGERYRQLYNEYIKDMRKQLMRRAGRRLGRATVGNMGRRRALALRHDNSRYP